MATNAARKPALLEVDDLSVTLYTRSIVARPVRKASFRVEAGQTLAIVGESGSGKTLASLSPLGLLPAGVTADLEGSVRLAGRELVGADEKTLMGIRGREVGIIFQDPMSALNPSRRIGSQLTEVIERYTDMKGDAASRRTHELMELVGIPNAKMRLKQYPHELSGGMCQRIMIAMAVAGQPSLLIADEPTTALDVTVQAQIIALLKDIQAQFRMAVVLITHDIGVVAGMADQIGIMYAGCIVEAGPAADVLLRPRHPYTRGLLASVCRPDDPNGSPFRGIPGVPPRSSLILKGCPFNERCSDRIAGCASFTPSLQLIVEGGDHLTACPVTIERPQVEVL